MGSSYEGFWIISNFIFAYSLIDGYNIYAMGTVAVCFNTLMIWAVYTY